MNTQIYYFSGTGNSLSVARKLSERIPDSEVTPMVSAYKNTVRNTNLLAGVCIVLLIVVE